MILPTLEDVVELAKNGTLLEAVFCDRCQCRYQHFDANQIRPWALGHSNWLFAGLLRSGKRAAAIMSLIQSARTHERHDPYAYLKDVLTRLPTQRASEIGQLLPHRSAPA